MNRAAHLCMMLAMMMMMMMMIVVLPSFNLSIFELLMLIKGWDSYRSERWRGWLDWIETH
jgi:biopolymer transport protein ExbB/TolQ